MAAARPPVAGPSGGAGVGAPAGSTVYGGVLMDVFSSYLILNLQDESTKWPIPSEQNECYRKTLELLSSSFPGAKNREWKDGISELSKTFDLPKPDLMAMSDRRFISHIENVMTDVKLDDNDAANTWKSIAKMFKKLFLAATESIENGQISRAITMPTVAHCPWRYTMIGPHLISLETYLNRPNSTVLLSRAARKANNIHSCSVCQCPKRREDAQFHSGLWRGQCSTCPERYWCLYDNCNFEHPGPSAKATTKHFKTTHPQPTRKRFLHCNSDDCLHPLYNVDPQKDSVNCLGCSRYNCLVANCEEVFPSKDELKNHLLNCRARRH